MHFFHEKNAWDQVKTLKNNFERKWVNISLFWIFEFIDVRIFLRTFCLLLNSKKISFSSKYFSINLNFDTSLKKEQLSGFWKEFQKVRSEYNISWFKSRNITCDRPVTFDQARGFKTKFPIFIPFYHSLISFFKQTFSFVEKTIKIEYFPSWKWISYCLNSFSSHKSPENNILRFSDEIKIWDIV